MNRIIAKEQFSEKVFKFEVEAPLIAKSRKAGHFVIVRVGEKGERMPLTIAGADPVKGTITLVVQKVGLSSTRLCELNVGDEVTDIVGPLGQATHIERFGTVVCAGGGVGRIHKGHGHGPAEGGGVTAHLRLSDGKGEIMSLDLLTPDDGTAEKMEAAEGLADQLDAMRVCDTTDLLSEINVPTLVIHGGRDIMVEPSEGAAVAGAVSGSRLLILESAGHSIPPELYLGEFRGFMDSNI